MGHTHTLVMQDSSASHRFWSSGRRGGEGERSGQGLRSAVQNLLRGRGTDMQVLVGVQQAEAIKSASRHAGTQRQMCAHLLHPGNPRRAATVVGG